MKLIAEGAKPRLRPDTEAGLKGEPLGERFAGHWVQAYYLSRLVAAAGGRLSTEIAENSHRHPGDSAAGLAILAAAIRLLNQRARELASLTSGAAKAL